MLACCQGDPRAKLSARSGPVMPDAKLQKFRPARRDQGRRRSRLKIALKLLALETIRTSDSVSQFEGISSIFFSNVRSGATGVRLCFIHEYFLHIVAR